ncbi:MAG: fused MFS/spermidine synthase [Verrucomicrobia bacterium]|nr:fused MFS/spermidine synthase [Verrucomicrobiota bacterium]
MTEGHHQLEVETAPEPRHLPFLILLFFGSGCAALIYEIVWFQLLQLVIGSSAVSLGVLLGTFMGGMCLGSLALPRLISPGRHPLRVYAWIELGIGLVGLAVVFLMPEINRLYAAAAGERLGGFLPRGIVAAICLLPPTLLMGATLPAMARWVEATPRGISWLGFFYGGNIAGAVFGCLFAGFYLLRVHDMAIATYVAASINGVIALLSFLIAAMTPRRETVGSNEECAAKVLASISNGPDTGGLVPRDWEPRSAWTVYAAIALSGTAALGAEVVWTRLLSLLLGATVYTFSIILAVFLAGLGIGSAVGSVLGRDGNRPAVLLGGCQFLLLAAIAWAACMLAYSLPFWPIDPSLSKNPWFRFQVDIVRCVWVILPAAVLWGASFPLALAAASRRQDSGRLVAGVYAANTVGAIIGAVVFSVILIQTAGTQQAQRVLIGISWMAAVLALAPYLWQARATAFSNSMKKSRRLSSTTATALCVSTLVAGLLATGVSPIPWGLVAYGRFLATRTEDSQLLYLGEGMNASVAVTELANGVRNFHVSGKVEASSEPQDMRLQLMLGHLPALLHPNPKSVLIVGCGAGVTSGSFVPYPGIERIVICEIEPLIPTVVARYFDFENNSVLKDPRVEVVYDDARHFILTTSERFDIITSDPIHPWVKGAATLYTKEYFELCRSRLNPGGLITQWVPLYESSVAVVKSEIGTFFSVFSNGTIWSNDDFGKGYDIVLLGQASGATVDVDAMQRRFDQKEHERAASSLKKVGFRSAISLLATYTGRSSELASWLASAEINRDRNLRLQYLAGLELNSYEGEGTYGEMLAYRNFPDEYFVGAARTQQALRQALGDSEN